MTNVGKRNRRVGVLTEVHTTNPLGQDVVGYKVTKTVWAYIHPLRGYEKIEGNMIENKERYTISFGYFKGLTESNYLKYNGQYFNIISICDVDMMHVEYECVCQVLVDKKIIEVD